MTPHSNDADNRYDDNRQEAPSAYGAGEGDAYEEQGEPIVLADDLAHEAALRVAALEAEVASLKDQVLRALADGENVRRRAEREKEDAGKFAVSSFAKDVLSVADNLRRALESMAGAQPDASHGEAVATLLAGVEATERELLGAMERRGIRRLFPMGERFDPNFHQAMFEIPSVTETPGTILQVLQPGYVLHERLLRPALVGVAKVMEPPNARRIDTQA
jgi:molecular chaperone GrpE